MPLRLNVGIAKKIGQLDFGSLGATCNVELELPGSMIFDDLDGFQRQVRDAYVACRQAVADELSRNQQNGSDSPSTERSRGNGQSSSNGNGHHNGNGTGHYRASSKQIDFINKLARQSGGVGVRKLETLAEKMFGKPIADLTSLDASGLIDTLKAIKAGDIDVETALNGATS